MKKTIAALLTCHNRRENTLICLNSLYQCRLPENYEINVYLVDDGSTDGTTVAVSTEFPQVNIIPGNGELFWNRGMYLAWKTASKTNIFDFYLWLNDDVVLFPSAIIDLLTATPDNDSIAVGTMCSRDKLMVTYGGWTLSGKLMIPTGVPEECNTFNGNLVLVPLIVYNAVGYLDPIFPHAIGDFDYALRAKKKGIKSYISSAYSGNCDHHGLPAKWCLPKVPFIQKVKNLYSPLGNSHPIYYFKFVKRHYGIFLATKHFLSIHLRLICPQLWKNRA